MCNGRILLVRSKDKGRWLRYDWPTWLKGEVTMVFSGRQTIFCILLLLSPLVSARSQSAVDKAAASTISGKVTVGGKGLSGVVVSNLRDLQFRAQKQTATEVLRSVVWNKVPIM